MNQLPELFKALTDSPVGPCFRKALQKDIIANDLGIDLDRHSINHQNIGAIMSYCAVARQLMSKEELETIDRLRSLCIERVRTALNAGQPRHQSLVTQAFFGYETVPF